jgi:hypothetical protein
MSRRITSILLPLAQSISIAADLFAASSTSKPLLRSTFAAAYRMARQSDAEPRLADFTTNTGWKRGPHNRPDTVFADHKGKQPPEVVHK